VASSDSAKEFSAFLLTRSSRLLKVIRINYYSRRPADARVKGDWDVTTTARFHVGINGDYRWIVTDGRLQKLVKLVPAFVLGKYIAVTSCECGPLRLSPNEVDNGWVARNGIAYSPRIESLAALPSESSCTEWYTFREPRDLGAAVEPGISVWESHIAPGRVHVFANLNFGFGLHMPEFAALAEVFWEQLHWVQPESYIAAGPQLTVVTRDRNLADALVRNCQQF
jgi:hypothetical protein